MRRKYIISPEIPPSITALTALPPIRSASVMSRLDDKCDEHKCDEKKEDKKHEQGRFLRREFSYTRFQQTLILPDDADTDKIEAKVKHGVLRIDIPKKAHGNEHKVSRMIAIE